MFAFTAYCHIVATASEMPSLEYLSFSGGESVG
jgi:hypothetical protein